MKYRYRVVGNMQVVVSTVVESETELTEREILDKAYDNWEGLTGFVGNGGFERLVGVNGPYDTIVVDDQSATFDDYWEEK